MSFQIVCSCHSEYHFRDAPWAAARPPVHTTPEAQNVFSVDSGEPGAQIHYNHSTVRVSCMHGLQAEGHKQII